jgi:hypothetical protein
MTKIVEKYSNTIRDVELTVNHISIQPTEIFMYLLLLGFFFSAQYTIEF